MYRYTKIEVGAGYDSTLVYPVFGPLKLFFDQTKDLQVYSQLHRLLPTDSEFTVPISSMLTVVYSWLIVSDYPVLVRLIQDGTTQLQMRTNNVSATNVGAPLPDQCFMGMSGTLPNTYMKIAPISGAVQTANVKVFASGDPQSAYL